MKKSAILVFAAALLLSACAGSGGRAKDEGHTGAPAEQNVGMGGLQYAYLPPQPPAMVPDGDKQAYMRDHFWDKFDFADTLFVARADTTAMLQSFALYVAYFAEPDNPVPFANLMRRASASKRMFDYFVMLAQEVLHDPNSPLRNDELYIPVLEAQLSVPFYDEYERMAPAYELRIVQQNRIGRRANDFRYTVASGRTSNLYSLAADYVLIFINNPGCPMCREIQNAITASTLLTDLQRNGRLKVLAIYPDRDLEAWREHAPGMPAGWINAYDKDCVIEEKGLYNLRAIPAMYLLDADKRVLIKDSTSVEEIEYMLASQLM